MRTNRHIALLLAGGKGCRMHQSHPKQFLMIEGKPLITYTMLAFQEHEEIDDIYVVCDHAWEAKVIEMARVENISKFKGCFPSGETSMQSLANGINGLLQTGCANNDIVLTHDSVRPLVSQKAITNNLKTCLKYGNAITGIQSNEAYMVSKDKIKSEGFIARDALFRAQTPQTFFLEDLIQVFRDVDAEVIQKAQSLYTLMAENGSMQLYIAQGDSYNLKVTIPEDIEIIQALIGWKKQNDME